MTIDEKLQHFYEVSLDEAREDAAQAIQNTKNILPVHWKITNRQAARMLKLR